MRPEVSIIMPVLNGEKYIGEAIESILAQTYRDYELIVVDDGCTDGTRDLLKQFETKLRLKVIGHSTRQGITRSVNDGIRAASGRFIAFLDHDDMWFPNFLQSQVTYLHEHPDVGMAHSDFQTITAEGGVIEASVAASRNRKRVSGHVFPQLFMDSFIVGNSVLIRKECFEHLGPFDEELPWGDYHMWLRIAKHYKVDYVPEVLTKYRQHATQNTREMPVEKPNMESVALIAIRKLLEQYPEIRRELGEKTVRRRMAALYFDMAYSWFSRGAFRYARLFLTKAMRLWPTQFRYYVLYAASLLRPAHALAMRNAWRKVRHAE
jgi:glycosyltransferase involved in cell wall biosynthesis